MIFDGFWVLSNTDRTWFSMFLIKIAIFEFFNNIWFVYHSIDLQNHQKPHILGVARFATDSKTSQMHQSDEFDENCGNYQIFCFRLSVRKASVRWFRQHRIRRILWLYEFVRDEHCFWANPRRRSESGRLLHHCRRCSAHDPASPSTTKSVVLGPNSEFVWKIHILSLVISTSVHRHNASRHSQRVDSLGVGLCWKRCLRT